MLTWFKGFGLGARDTNSRITGEERLYRAFAFIIVEKVSSKLVTVGSYKIFENLARNFELKSVIFHY